MKKMSKSVAITSAIAAGVAMAASTGAIAGEGPGMEKCYGVVKAGKNDCAIKSQGTSCAGAAKKDAIGDSWIYLPKGSCEKIVGGSVTVKEA